MFSLSDHPHRRYNPLADEWVVVSPHRTKRPWQGQVEPPLPDTRPAYDPECYLCPSNPRAGGATNPAYSGTFAFDNDYAALMPDVPPGELSEGPADGSPLLRAVAERGICRVLCYSPRHDLAMPQLAPEELRTVVDAWAAQYADLATYDWVRHVLIFENRGAMMGASNPHPHGQIWGTGFLPGVYAREHAAQLAYHSKHGRALLSDYVELELERGERIVCANEHFVALVPFWAVWPFETMVLARRPAASLLELDGPARDGLAAILKALTTGYDALFQVAFPYSMGLHQAPTDGAAHPEWQLHAHFLPPLLRSATVRKFMVGFELMGEPQRDITPEQAAARLRELM